jgi:HEAT repeat protein
MLAMLNDESADTRFNTCRALKRLKATSALETLTGLAATDPDKDVRSVAQVAIDSIEESYPRCFDYHRTPS